MNNQQSVGELSDALAARAENLCRHYFPQGQKRGIYWYMGDVSGKKGKSLAIRLQASGGRKAGSWNDYAGGADDYGDLIDLLQKHFGHANVGKTLIEVKAFLGKTPSPARELNPTSTAEEANKRLARARKLIKYSIPTYRTPASAYLLGRGIKRFGPSLRYNKRVYVWTGGDEPEKYPALLAKITDYSDTMTGVARYFLNARTGKLADFEGPKRVLGRLHGNAVRFSTGIPQDELIAGEGLENVLSIGTALRDSDLASCLTANHLALFNPPKRIKRLWIARDNDEAGEDAAARLKARAEELGLWCGELVPDGNDFNFDLTSMGLDAFRDHLLSQMR